MKKFLLSLMMCVIGTIIGRADVCTVTYSTLGYANAEDVTTVATGDANISIVCAQGTSQNPPKYYTTGSGLRMYNGNTMTISAADGCEITEVVFTASASNYAVKGSTANVGNFSQSGATSTWTGNAGEIVLTSSSTCRLQKMEITYTAGGEVGEKVSDVVISADNNGVVTMECETEGADIYFGFAADAIDNQYTGAFSVTEACTVYAKAVKGDVSSRVTSLYVSLPYHDFKSVIANAADGVDVTVAGNFEVIYHNGSNTIVTDGKSNILLYDKNVTKPVGTKLSRIEAKVTLYSSLFELSSCTLTEGGEGASIEPVVLASLSDVNYDDNLFDLVMVKGAAITGVSGKNGKIELAGESMAMYNNFNLDNYANAECVDVTAFVWRNNTTLQLSPIEIVEGEPAPKEPVEFEGLVESLKLYEGQSASIFNTDLLPEVFICGANDETIAVCDADGMVTAKAVGETEVLVMWEGDENYLEGEATVKVSVVERPDYVVATIDFSKLTDLKYHPETHVTWVSEEDANITFDTYATVTGSTYPQYVESAGALRIYSSNGNKLYVNAPEGYYFVEVDPETGNSGSVTINGVRAAESAKEDDIHTFDGDELFETEFVIESTDGAVSGEGKNTDLKSLVMYLKPFGETIDHKPVVVDADGNVMEEETLYVKHEDEGYEFHFYLQEMKNLNYHYNLTYEFLNSDPVQGDYGVLAEDDEMVFTPYNADEHIVIPANAFGTLTYYAEHKSSGIKSAVHTLAIDGGVTGVEGIEIDGIDGEAVYYNLQGVRVSEPAQGLYIVVRGDKAVKQIVR